MVRENKSKGKLCLFFASDYHFEMISLPYINKNLKKDKNVIMITENDLEDSVDKVLSSITLNQEEKDKITKIDWKNNDLNKFREIKRANEECRDTVVFVKGKESYIDTINKNIENWTSGDNIEIINCYDINEIHDDVEDIAKSYGGVLSTYGVEDLSL